MKAVSRLIKKWACVFCTCAQCGCCLSISSYLTTCQVNVLSAGSVTHFPKGYRNLIYPELFICHTYSWHPSGQTKLAQVHCPTDPISSLQSAAVINISQWLLVAWSQQEGLINLLECMRDVFLPLIWEGWAGTRWHVGYIYSRNCKPFWK